MTTLILVRPQLGENIGMAARAMLNCGFKKLRLVAPRDGWPNPTAYPASAGADQVLENLQLFDSVEESITDLTYIAASTARNRDMEKPVHCLPEWQLSTAEKENMGVLFGAEASGLSNDELNLADALITIPVNPEFPSLNLAQSVYAVCTHLMKPASSTQKTSSLAPKKDLIYFLETLEHSLDQKNFFRPAGKKPLMKQNLVNIFSKAQLTPQEIQTLHGVLKALMK